VGHPTVPVGPPERHTNLPGLPAKE
jgi:hypothetical protein